MCTADKEILKIAFKSSNRMTAQLTSTLRELGIEVLQGGSHYKLRRIDRVGGFVVIAKTPSDFRAGANTVSCLWKLLEMEV